MIIFLILLYAVAAFGDETLVASRDGAEIEIEWTKTEKLKISIPVLGSEDSEKYSIDCKSATPIASSAVTSDPGTEIPTQAATENIPIVETPTTESTVWSEGSTQNSFATTESLTTVEDVHEQTFSGEPEQSTTSSNSAEESSSRTTESTSNESEMPNETTSTTDETTTTPCSDTLGKDFIFLIDAVAFNEREKLAQLIEAFLNVIKNDHPCDRIALVSYADQNYAFTEMLIPLTIGVDNTTVLDALKTPRNYTGPSDLIATMHYAVNQVLDKPKYSGLALKVAGKERIIVIVATSDGEGRMKRYKFDPPAAEYHRAMLTDMFGAHILLVTIGEPRPLFQCFAPDDETIKIGSFANFSTTEAITELCCRFSMCSVKETEMCALVKAREIERQHPKLHPKCEEKPARATDAAIVIDRAGMKHRSAIISLAEAFINLIDPWNTENRLHVGSYANGTAVHSYSKAWWPASKIDSKEVMLDNIAKIPYDLGNGLVGGMHDGISMGMRWDEWRNQTRQRIMIIIASSAPSKAVCETVAPDGCSHFFEFMQEAVGRQRAAMNTQIGGKIFLVTIGDLPMEILRHAAPETEIVKIESFEKLSIPPIIEEFKRRFCM